MLRKLRIAFSVCCGIFCLLLIVLWVRSYSALDVFNGLMPNGTAIQCTSTKGQIFLASFPSPTRLTWSWESITESQMRAALNTDIQLRLLEKEQHVVLTLLENRRSQSIRRNPKEVAPETAQINHIKAEWETIMEGRMQLVIAQVLGNPDLLTNRLQFSKASTCLGFGARNGVTGWAIACPHWFPTVLSIGLMTTPWIKCRYSLRTLLIATTLVALLLGAAVCAIR